LKEYDTWTYNIMMFS